MDRIIRLRVLSIMLLIGGVLIVAQETPQAEPVGPVVHHPQVSGSLDMANDAPIRWQLPAAAGGGFINIMTLDKNGTLRLCDDPYFYEGNDQEQLYVRVIEIRNPYSAYPDFRVPITRTDNINADSKVIVRSMSVIETNDPSEINLVRTGTDDIATPDENGVIGNGAVTGLIRWMGRRAPAQSGSELSGGLEKAVEIIGRSFGTSTADAYGMLSFHIYDKRNNPQDKYDSEVMNVSHHGMRVGPSPSGREPACAMLEVNSYDDRPVILRRPNAGANEPVVLALAVGRVGEAADEGNSLALLKAGQTKADPIESTLEIQTNRGGRLSTDWVLPVPAARVQRDTNQPLATATDVVVVFNHKLVDTAAMYSPAENASRLVCRTAGLYQFGAGVEFTPHAQGSRQVQVRKNETEVVAAMRMPAVVGETTQITFSSPPVEMREGDFVELVVRQTSGETLDLVSSGAYAPVLSMTRVG